uniref:Uncharacterized protein n=1 Tax=Tanacetum cinerariifolium TaxID=118510 RepID=A0A6L2J4R3_TANCI|nr:hypothetical protein [Tanacetum cinerariifolium]
MRRISKGFSGIETPLFATVLVQPQAATEEEDEEDEVSAAPTPPSPTHEPTPPSQEPITLPQQAQPAPPSSQPQEQPTTTSTSDMTLLNALLEICTTLSHKVAALEQDKVAQALEIYKLKRKVKRLEMKRRSKHSGLKRLKKVGTSQRVESSTETVVGAKVDASKQGGRIKAIDANEEITLVDIETEVYLDGELQEMKEDDNDAIKKVNTAKPTVFDDEEMAKRLHDEEVKQAAAREQQEQDDLKRAQELPQQYDKKKENIDWNFVAEQMQEKHLDNIRKYSLKRKPISIAQARKNMIVYLKNMAGDEEPTKKRVAKETLLQESFKKLRAEVEVLGSHSTQDTPTDDPKEMSKENVKNMLEIVPVSKFKVKALQVKVGEITQAYHSFEELLKDFDREDLDDLWRLAKEKFSTVMPTKDKEKALWVGLKRLYEPNAADVFWKLQRYMHDPWKLYTNYEVHQVSSTRRHDIFMFREKDYPLTNAVLLLMLSTKLQVDEDCEMAKDLVMNFFMEANKPKSRRSLDTSSK